MPIKTRIVALVSVLLLFQPASVYAQSCLAVPIMSEPGERVMSPYGVDRSMRPGASAGYHQGLDIVNSAGRGDPIFAGIHGTVFVAKGGSGGNKVGVTSSDGTQRFIYFHLDSMNVRVGDTVAPDTVVGIQGSTGVSYTAVHLHLSSLLRGDVLRTFGNAGRVWRTQHGWVGTKRSSPLSAAQIGSALPNDYYFVNPETFLHHRIPMSLPGAYIQQGLSRPDGLTLPPTCAPSSEFFDMSAARSANGGVSLSDGLSADAGYFSPEESVNAAVQEFKEAAINLAQVAAGDLSRQNIVAEADDHRALGWAGLVAAVGD